jgi:hypothetical protein
LYQIATVIPNGLKIPYVRATEDPLVSKTSFWHSQMQQLISES